MEETASYIDTETFEKIFHLYGTKVYAVAMYHIQDREIARDIVQDIFKSIWERREALSIQGPIEHYLARAAKLKVLEYIRKEQTRKEKIQQLRVSYKEEDHSTLGDIDYKDLLGQTWAALEALPARTQDIFLQSRKEGLSNKEIVIRTQLSEKSVEYHITRALNHLRNNIPTEQ